MKDIQTNLIRTYSTTHSIDFYRGKSFHYAGVWTEGAHYVNDEYNVDFVTYDKTLLVCTKSHLATLKNRPNDWIRDENDWIIGLDSECWAFIHTGKNADDEAEYVRWLLNEGLAQETGYDPKLIMSQKAVTEALDEERSRAESAENQLQSNINAEKDRATKREDELDSTIKEETSRATNKEAELQKNIDSEKNRATQAEEQLQSNIDKEQQRAEKAEDALNKKIESETNRATSAEEQLKSDLAEETKRATNKETELQNNINSEKDRATSAEEKLASDIASETDRAKTKESELEAAIKSEKDRAEKAESDLDTKIENEIARVEGSANGIQAELDRTQVGAGLKDDGTYTKNDSSKYIKNATSLNNADVLLNNAIEEVANSLNELDARANADKQELIQLIADTKASILGEDFDEAFDTLKEIGDWIKDHQDLYEALLELTQNRIKELEAKIKEAQEAANNKHTTDLEKAKQELESKISELESKLENLDIPSLEGYATEQWVLNKHYLTEHQDLSDYATKEDLEKIDVTDQLKDYAKTSDVESKIQEAIDGLETPSLDGYATETWVKQQKYLTEHQSLDDYATKQYVTNNFSENIKKYLVVEKITRANYNAAVQSGTLDENKLYAIIDM